MSYATTFPGEPERLHFTEIHRSACAVANREYREKYGIDKSEDPDFVVDGDRHIFWISSFDRRQTSLFINPHQP